MGIKVVKFGIVGLGRLGLEHAKNLAARIPGAKLTALCDVDEQNLIKVGGELDVAGLYTDFEKMCKEADIDAVVIVSPSAYHTANIETAMNYGKHVFSEKPLDVSIERCKEAEKIVEAHPDLKFQIGYMRRYDNSYRIAKQRLDAGEIGKLVLIRCYSQDGRAIIEGNLAYAPRSGGQFLDMSIHDMDLCRWFTGGQEPKKLWAIGGQFEFPQYKEWDDGDNVSVTIQYEDDTMAFLFANRVAAHGSHVETELIGTKGAIRIGAVGTDTMNEYYTENGVCREVYDNFVDRWHQAYINELEDFVDAIITNRTPEATVYDGTATLNTAFQCKESFIKNELIDYKKA